MVYHPVEFDFAVDWLVFWLFAVSQLVVVVLLVARLVVVLWEVWKTVWARVLRWLIRSVDIMVEVANSVWKEVVREASSVTRVMFWAARPGTIASASFVATPRLETIASLEPISRRSLSLPTSW